MVAWPSLATPAAMCLCAIVISKVLVKYGLGPTPDPFMQRIQCNKVRQQLFCKILGAFSRQQGRQIVYGRDIKHWVGVNTPCRLGPVGSCVVDFDR